MATAKQQVAQIYATLGPADQQRIEDIIAEKGWGAAYGAAVVLKHQRSKTTTKQGPGDALDTAYQALRTAYDAGDGAAVQGALQQLITAVQAPPVKASAKLADHQKPRTKEARTDDTFLGFSGISETISGQSREMQEQLAAINPYKNGYKWW